MDLIAALKLRSTRSPYRDLTRDLPLGNPIRTEVNDEKAFRISDASYRLQDFIGAYHSIDRIGWSLP